VVASGVIHAAVHVLFYAIIAAASPLVLTATFVVIRSDRPSTNGIAFLTGFLVGTAIACLVGLVVGATAASRLDSRSGIENLLAFLLGVALLGVGLKARTAPPRPVSDGSSRSSAILAGLGHAKPAAALSMAALLGFGGPKRLLLTLLAMAAVTEAHLSKPADTTLVLLYIGLATILVTVPVGFVILAGERAAEIVRRGESWLTEHAVVLGVWLAIGLGLALIGDAIVRQFG
jgi:hypothetical protein